MYDPIMGGAGGAEGVMVKEDIVVVVIVGSRSSRVVQVVFATDGVRRWWVFGIRFL